jgi:DNA-binding IclR family transcriptional regulator
LIALGSDAALTEGGLGVTRLATITGHEKSQVSRALAVLAEHGLVERSPGLRGYRLGWECFTLVTRAGEPRLIEEAGKALAQLVDEADESAHLSTLRGAMVLTLLTRASPHAIAARSWVGRTIPAHCTSSGRALCSTTTGMPCSSYSDQNHFHLRVRTPRPTSGSSSAELAGPVRRATPWPTRNPSQAWWRWRRRFVISPAA